MAIIGLVAGIGYIAYKHLIDNENGDCTDSGGIAMKTR
jgi:hypothetical protein